MISLLHDFPTRLVWAAYVCVNGFVIIGLLALVTGSPFVFPTLGPTAYLFFFSPHRPGYFRIAHDPGVALLRTDHSDVLAKFSRHGERWPPSRRRARGGFIDATR
jgi:hypothetical protein